MYRTYPELDVRMRQIKSADKNQPLTSKSETHATFTPTSSSGTRGQPTYVTGSNQVRALQEWQREHARLSSPEDPTPDGAVYRMETGLDGKRYAVGADVRIDVTSGRTPREILTRAHPIQPATSPVHEASAATDSSELQPSPATPQSDGQVRRLIHQYQNSIDSAHHILATEA